MSLLMDALRRAEAAKGDNRENDPVTDQESNVNLENEELQLEPVAEVASEQSESSPALTDSEIDEILDFEEEEPDQPPAQESLEPTPTQESEPAVIMPVAETSGEVTSGEVTPNPAAIPLTINAHSHYKTIAWFLGGTVVVFMLVGGYYVWQVNRSDDHSLIDSTVTSPLPTYNAPLTEPADQADVVEVQSSEKKPAPQLTITQAAYDNEAGKSAITEKPVATATNRQTASTEIRIHKTTRADSIQPVLQKAYLSYKRKEYSQAYTLYQQVLKRYPHNRDALLGLAAICILRGDYVLARRNYERLLKYNPSDTSARIGLQSIQGNEDPVRQISQLKLLLDRNPRDAQLHFSLANHYTQLGQWKEAQNSYFEASRLEPDQADYAYNLAISLDRLGLSAQALEFYLKAQRLATDNASVLDHGQLSLRIRQLQKATGKLP